METAPAPANLLSLGFRVQGIYENLGPPNPKIELLL